MMQDGEVRPGVRGGFGWEAGALLLGLVALVGVSAGGLVWQGVRPVPIRFGGLTLDRMSMALAFLVAVVGAVTFRFALRYLDGERGQRGFLRLLCVTVAAAYLVMLATHLLLLLAAWSLTSLGLHALLTFYRDRKEAYPPARKKFLISRLSDLMLITAIVLIWRDAGTLDLHVYLDRVAAGVAQSGGVVAFLVAGTALTRSAQFPFHSWLPETMEAPTPVSALMHAGIINASGALLLRFAPLLVRVPEALFLLAFVGSATAALGLVAMWAQVKVKRTLAWSTVSQMGFMMIQCGLGAFPVAFLHILGHGFYKAWSFLRTGDLPRGKSLPARSPRRALTLAAAGTLLSLPGFVLGAVLMGYSPLHSPGELALAAVVALAVGQIEVALLGPSNSKPGRMVLGLLALVVVPVTACGLYRAVGDYLAPVLGDLPAPGSPLAWAGAGLPVLVLAVLAVLHAWLPALGQRPWGRALFVHASHGFYVGIVADRVVARVWPSAPALGFARAEGKGVSRHPLSTEGSVRPGGVSRSSSTPVVR